MNPILLDFPDSFDTERLTIRGPQHADAQEIATAVNESLTSTFVAGSGLHRIDWAARKFEIGYWCRSGYVGHGYVTEAVNAITEFAFTYLQANRVEIRCDTRNTRSIAVARRCGFLQEGILRHDSLGVDGELRSTFVFAKISPNEFNYYDAAGQKIEG